MVMKSLEVRMLGLPCVYFEGAPVQFKYQKAEAIFYYIAFNRSVDRAKIMGLFWPEETEEKARKNLRNAVYSIRQAFDIEVVTNIGQRLICFSDAVHVVTDCDAINGEADALGPGEFLDSFVLKDTPDFEEWVFQMREDVRSARIKHLNHQLNAALEQNNDPEDFGREILKLDPFDETTCRKLMKYYMESGQPGKCLDIYSRLCQTLEEELSLKPEQETVQLFQEIIENRRIRGGAPAGGKGFFFGRAAEMAKMERFCENRKIQRLPGTIMISGEAGVGKTTLMRRFVEEESRRDLFRISYSCHEGDEQHFLKGCYPMVLRMGELFMERGLHPGAYQKEVLSRVFPTFMNTMPTGSTYQMEKLGQVPLQVITKMTADIVALSLEMGPLLIQIEDIQWMDPWSMELLKRVILELETGAMLVLASYRTPGDLKIEDFSSELQREDRLLSLRLARFSKEETEAFIEEYPGSDAISSSVHASVYVESEGNPLILTEILKSLIESGSYDTIPTRVRTIFYSRYQHLNNEARKLADLISAFSEPISWHELKAIYGKTELELLDILEELIYHEFIEESGDFKLDTRYQYSHQKLKDFVYNSQSSAKRRLIHKRIGDYYKEQLTNTSTDRFFYPKLIFHYERSAEKALQLEYRILNLYDHLEISHELFPRIKDWSIIPLNASKSDFTDDFVEKEIKGIEAMMSALTEKNGGQRLRLVYLNMISRYHILQGDVNRGRGLTQQMIREAEAADSREFVLKGYLQLIFNAINQRDISEMENLLQTVFVKLRKGTDKGEMGVFIRLKGYLMILRNRFEQGESLLQSAARIFEQPQYQEAYALNRIAAYYYLGESRRLQSDYSGAIHWFREAEALCRDQGFSSHLAMVLCSIGVASYDNGHMQNAESYLKQAVDLYDVLQFKWGQISAYAYWGLVCLRKGSFTECQKNIRKADQLASSFGHAYEVGLMLRIKAEICCVMRTVGSHKGLEEYLCLASTSYCKEAFSFFREHPNFTYEEKILSDLNRICAACVNYP